MAQITLLKSTALQYLLDQIANAISGEASARQTDMAEIRKGRMFYLPAAESPSGLDVPVTATMVSAVHFATATVTDWRNNNAPADGLETAVLKKDINGRWWRLVENASTAQERADRISSDQAIVDTAGAITLVNVAGTPDAITADFPAGIGLTTFIAGKLFRLTTLADSTGPTVTVKVSNVTRTLIDTDLAALPEGFILKGGRTYLFETYGSQFARLVSTAENFKERRWQRIEDTIVLADGSIQLETATDPDGEERTIRTLTSEGHRMALDPVTCDEAFTKGSAELGPILLDGGRDMISAYRGETYLGALARLYPGGRIEMPGLVPESQSQRATFYGPYAEDVFETINGLKAPSLFLDYAGETHQREIDLYLHVGQSLADATPSDMSLYWKNGSPWRWHTFMLNDLSANENRGGMRGWGAVVAPGATGLVHAKNDVFPVTGAHDRTQYTTDVWANAVNFYSSRPPRVAVCRASSTGGNPFIGDANLANKGIWKQIDHTLDPSDPNYETYTQTWLNTLQDITEKYNYASAMGYPVGKLKIMLSHQEANNATPYQEYLDQANGYKAEIEAYVASLDPDLPVVWYVNQAGGSAKGGVGNGNAWEDRLAIADFSRQHDNVIFTIPKYHLRFGVIDGVLDDVHIDAWSNAILGEAAALAEIERELGRDWYPPYPASTAISGNDVTVDFNSLGRLVLDPGMCSVRSDMGFILAGDIRATEVRITGPKQVTATFPQAPQAGVDVLQYAYRSVAADDPDNQGYPVGTGALRDNFEQASKLFPGTKILRPAEGFRIQL